MRIRRRTRWWAQKLVRLVLVVALRVRCFVEFVTPRTKSGNGPEGNRGIGRGTRDVAARQRKIALFIQTLRAGGGVVCLLTVARDLVARGFCVDLLVLHTSRSDRHLVPEGVRLTNFQRRDSIAALPQLLRYLKREPPDVLLVNNPYPGVAALIAKGLFLRSLSLVYRHANTFSREAPTPDSRLLRYFLPFADAIITISRGATEDFKRSFPNVSHLVRYVPNAAVTPDIAEQATSPVDHPWFNDPTQSVVLSVARLAPQKDLATLLRAFAEVVRSRPARLVILGEGTERTKLTLLARELGISPFVQFPGDIRPAFPYMAKARLFVLSSAWEGLSMVLLEAMACGTPVVSTDCPYGPSEILEGGKWGRLVPPGDWRSLASAILETLDAPVASDLLIARASRWDAESGIARYLQVLEDVLNPSGEASRRQTEPSAGDREG